MDCEQRADVPCDREHLNELRAPSSDVAVPSNPAALESIARLLTHQPARQPPSYPSYAVASSFLSLCVGLCVGH